MGRAKVFDVPSLGREAEDDKDESELERRNGFSEDRINGASAKLIVLSSSPSLASSSRCNFGTSNVGIH